MQITQKQIQSFRELNWPKHVAELHVHLGGSVPLYRLWEIAIARGIRGMGNGYEEFIQRLKREEDRVTDLDSYLEIYDRIELIQSGPDAVRESLIIAIHRAYLTGGMVHLGPSGEALEESSLFSIANLELRFNPLKRTGAVFLKGQHAGLFDVDRIMGSACRAIQDVEIGFKNKIHTGLLICFGRDMTHEANMILAEKVAKWTETEKQIVGIDLAGPESADPLSDPGQLARMKLVFDTVGKKIGRTIHVGETEHVSIDTFIKTVETLEPQRVAHPITACRAYWQQKDDRGLKLLKERDIVCELCVKSNLLTRAVGSIEEYARVVQTFDDFEIPYTFSTDAPSLQITSLASELLLLYASGGINEEQILRSLAVAEQSSFLQ